MKPVILTYCITLPLYPLTDIHHRLMTSHLRIYSRLSLSRSRRYPLKHFEISVLRHIRFAALRKIPIKQPNEQMNMQFNSFS